MTDGARLITEMLAAYVPLARAMRSNDLLAVVAKVDVRLSPG